MPSRRTEQPSFGSGALLFDKDTFAQVLEGDRVNVSQLFIRICGIAGIRTSASSKQSQSRSQIAGSPIGLWL
ncbi:BLUF domain-containing protein (plasmid) [Bradyrhizobium sp. PMVTL-01]|uniref:BLUF domain-containing protein n=1 Tax=Bradyrhizobium sp. PMVTL-01 TaxID=3434999 RepID=UPI003F6E6EDA